MTVHISKPFGITLFVISQSDSNTLSYFIPIVTQPLLKWFLNQFTLLFRIIKFVDFSSVEPCCVSIHRFFIKEAFLSLNSSIVIVSSKYRLHMGLINSSLNAVSCLCTAILMVVSFPAKLDWYYSGIWVTLGLFPIWFSDRTKINMINWYAV